MRFHSRCCLLTFMLPPVLTSICSGQEPSVKEQQTALRKVLNDSFDEFEIRTNNGGKVAEGKIVFRWDNRERGSADGATALWYDESERPIAIASIYPWNGNLVHDFDVIDRRRGLIGKRNGRSFWDAPDKTAIKFKPVPGAKHPAESEKLRRLQLKAMAAEYSVTMTGWRGDGSDKERLRMLPTPVHRYGRKVAEPDLIDGAIFLFVKGTDPEAALVLEAHKHDGEYRWEYSLISQTSGSLEATHRKKPIWKKAIGASPAGHGHSATALPPGLRDLR